MTDFLTNTWLCAKAYAVDFQISMIYFSIFSLSLVQVVQVVCYLNNHGHEELLVFGNGHGWAHLILFVIWGQNLIDMKLRNSIIAILKTRDLCPSYFVSCYSQKICHLVTTCDFLLRLQKMLTQSSTVVSLFSSSLSPKEF